MTIPDCFHKQLSAAIVRLRHVVGAVLLGICCVMIGLSTAQAATETIDNLETEKTIMVGSWRTSDGPDPYLGNSISGSGSDKTFTWMPDLPEGPGDYLVEVYWTYQRNQSTQVPYCIDDDSGGTCVEFNQRDPDAAAKWTVMGQFTCATASCDVTVSGINGTANADAVRFTFISPPEPPPEWPIVSCPCDEYFSRAIDIYLGLGGDMGGQLLGRRYCALGPNETLGTFSTLIDDLTEINVSLSQYEPDTLPWSCHARVWIHNPNGGQILRTPYERELPVEQSDRRSACMRSIIDYCSLGDQTVP